MYEKNLGREREIQFHFLNMKKKTTEVTFSELIHKANKSKCRMNKNRDLAKDNLTVVKEFSPLE